MADARKVIGAYKAVFLGPNGQLVLRDLARFCRANDTVYHPEQRKTDVLIGRHEVWLRLQRFLNLTAHDLHGLTREISYQQQDEDEL